MGTVKKKDTASAKDVHVNPVTANALTIGSSDQIATLAKLQPVILPNQSPQLYETQALKDLRTSYKYIYVINWLYHCRGFIKLQSEYFDVDIFELELMNYFPNNSFLLNAEEQPNINNLFIYKLKIHLITALQNSKLSSVNNFEKIFRLWFGVDTPLGGVEEEDEDDEEGVTNGENKSQIGRPEAMFDDLTISDKFEILYILISYISSYSSYRSWIDRNNLGAEELRVDPVFTDHVNQSQEDYFLFCDGCRLVKRTLHFPSLVIPKKRKLAPEYPDEFYNAEQFDVKPTIKFELIFKNIYELNDLAKEWSRKKTMKFKTLYTKLTKPKYLEIIFENEIKKRRFLTNKKKDLQLASLLATRKRSSRLEAKEKQRQEELKLREEQEAAEMLMASTRRSERRMKMKLHQQDGTPDYTGGLSRDERLKLRKLNTPEAAITPEPSQVEQETTSDAVNTEPVPENDQNEYKEPEPKLNDNNQLPLETEQNETVQTQTNISGQNGSSETVPASNIDKAPEPTQVEITQVPVPTVPNGHVSTQIPPVYYSTGPAAEETTKPESNLNGFIQSTVNESLLKRQE